MVREAKVSFTPTGKVKQSELPVIRNSEDARRIVEPYYDGIMDLAEKFCVILLSRANRVLGVYQHSVGGMTGTVVDRRLIITTALNCGAVGILLVHNHPSGSLQPSQADIELTNNIRKACTLLEISVVDHLILTEESLFSFTENEI